MMRFLHRWLLIFLFTAAASAAPVDTAEKIRQLLKATDAYPQTDVSVNETSRLIKWKELQPVLEELCGRGLYLTENTLVDTGIRNVDPVTIQCLTKNVERLSGTPHVRDMLAPIYNRYLRTSVRKYYLHGDFLVNNLAIYREMKDEYKNENKIDKTTQKHLSKIDRLPGIIRLDNYGRDALIVKFWFRRHMDKSGVSLKRFLAALIKTFDPFYERLLHEHENLPVTKTLAKYGCQNSFEHDDNLNLSCMAAAYFDANDEKLNGFLGNCEGSDEYPCQLYSKVRSGRQIHLSEFLELLDKSVRENNNSFYKDSLLVIGDLFGWKIIFEAYLYNDVHLRKDVCDYYPAQLADAASRDFQLVSIIGKTAFGQQSPATVAAQKIILGLDYFDSTIWDRYDLVKGFIKSSKFLTGEQKDEFLKKISKDWAYVLSSIANIRSAPEKNADIVAKLKIRTRVTIAAQGGDWSSVRYWDYPQNRKRQGWVHSSLVGSSPPTLEEMLKQYNAESEIIKKRMWAERAVALDEYNITALTYLAAVLEKMGDVKNLEAVKQHITKIQ